MQVFVIVLLIGVEIIWCHQTACTNESHKGVTEDSSIVGVWGLQ